MCQLGFRRRWYRAPVLGSKGYTHSPLPYDWLFLLDPNIVIEKWKLLEYFTTGPDDSQLLRWGIDNLGLMEVIKGVADPMTMVL